MLPNLKMEYSGRLRGKDIGLDMQKVRLHQGISTYHK